MAAQQQAVPAPPGTLVLLAQAAPPSDTCLTSSRLALPVNPSDTELLSFAPLYYSAYAEEISYPTEAAAPVGAEADATRAAPVGAAAVTAAPTGVAPVAAAAPPPEESALSKEIHENLSHLNPLPENMDKECEKAGETLDNVIQGGQGMDFFIPKSILDRAKGLAVLHVVKVAWGWSGRVGSGIVVAKLPDGTWSAPSAVAMAGAGWGAQVGAQVSDLVICLMTDDAVKSFMHRANITFGVEIAFAIGPIGRHGEVDIALADFAPMYTYSKTKGLFAGISLEGSALIERRGANEAKYGKGVTAMNVLSGQVPRPEGADHLYNSLAELDRRALQNAKEAAEKMKPTSEAPDF